LAVASARGAHSSRARALDIQQKTSLSREGFCKDAQRNNDHRANDEPPQKQTRKGSLRQKCACAYCRFRMRARAAQVKLASV